jgi:hypothetical protein
MTTEDTNKLITEVAFDIITISTLWSLVLSSNSGLDHYSGLDSYNFFSENKYFNYSATFQDITKLVAFTSSAIVIAKYFRM